MAQHLISIAIFVTEISDSLKCCYSFDYVFILYCSKFIFNHVIYWREKLFCHFNTSEIKFLSAGKEQQLDLMGSVTNIDGLIDGNSHSCPFSK